MYITHCSGRIGLNMRVLAASSWPRDSLRLVLISYKCSSIKFCNYNFVLNKVPNNSDAMCVANIVLNEVPSNNNATGIANYVCLTTIIAQQFSMVASYIVIM